jgi:hypothetical protein
VRDIEGISDVVGAQAHSDGDAMDAHRARAERRAVVDVFSHLVRQLLGLGEVGVRGA